jgi:hypothetical protein
MTYLCKLVSLKDKDQFVRAAEAGQLCAFFQDKTGYPVLTAKVLGVDRENRIYDTSIKYENQIFDIAELSIRDSQDVLFSNCVFLGNLIVGGHDATRKIVLDNCLVLESLHIHGNDVAPLDVSCWKTNCAVMEINYSNFRTIDVNGSSLYKLYLSNAQCDSLVMYSNRVRYLRLEGFNVARSNFYHGQVDISESFRPPQKKRQEVEKTDWAARASVLLDFPPGDNIHSESVYETFAFLRERTLINGDQRSLSALRYRAALLSQSRFSRIIVRLTGGFERPWLFATYAVVILLLFAGVFTTRWFGFVSSSEYQTVSHNYVIQSNVRWGLGFLEALYFSCITFSTVGYGDLVPIGGTRAFAAIEGLLGVLTAGAFLVSLVKRYMEK